MSAIVVTGTDTGIGKTVFAAGLTGALGAAYWKPIQSGLEGPTDSETVRDLTGRGTLAEAYRLDLPASPHLAAEAQGVTIDFARLALPEVAQTLVVEGAGGVMVPIDRRTFMLDLFAQWGAPVILVARTALGTINHTALSLRALRGAGCPVLGVAFVGDAVPSVEDTITGMCAVRHLGRLPVLPQVTANALRDGFAGIDLAAIREAL